MKSKKNQELNFLYFEDKSDEKKKKKNSPRGQKKKQQEEEFDYIGEETLEPKTKKRKKSKEKFGYIEEKTDKKKKEEFDDIEEQYEFEKERKGKNKRGWNKKQPEESTKRKTRKSKEDKKEQAKEKIKSKKGQEDEIEENNNVFRFDNEIVIGVTKIQAGGNKKNTTSKANTKTNTKKKASNKKKKGAGGKSAPYRKKKAKKKQKLSFILIKWTILFGALVVAIIFFMMSPLFDITGVEVIGNEKISKETILSLSGISLGDNLYRNKKETIQKNIKQEAYIESVEVKRVLPDKIQLQVKERKATFLLEYANSYFYMDNQGYILEVSSQMLELPIIKGYTTPMEEVEVGGRLNKEDLTRLEVVLKIVEAIASNGITAKVNRIDISNKQNYTLSLDEEKKTVYLGDASHLSSRMLYIKVALEDTKGLEGEIFAGGDLEREKVFFRERQPEPDPPPEPDPVPGEPDQTTEPEGDSTQE